MRKQLFVGLAGAVMTAWGCSTCDEMACGDPFLSLEFASALVEEGEYRFEFVVDGAASDCVVAIPAPSVARVACEGWSILREEIETEGPDGSRSASAGNAIVGLGLEGVAEHVRVRVSLNDLVVFDTEARPVYRPLELNGSGCGTCDRANVTVDTSNT